MIFDYSIKKERKEVKFQGFLRLPSTLNVDGIQNSAIGGKKNLFEKARLLRRGKEDCDD